MSAKSMIRVPRSPLFRGDARRCVQRWGTSPRTRALPVLSYEDYGSDAWREARRVRVGASEMAAVLGLSPYESPFSLWWKKQRGWFNEQTLAMMIGHELEPIIGRLFARERPDLLVCRANGSLWTHPAEAFMACSPDFIAVASDRELCTHGADCEVHPDENRLHNFDDRPARVWIEPVECKSDEGGRGWGKPGTDEIPEHHRVQALQQCYVFDAPRGHVVRMAGKRFSTYTVELDDAARDDLYWWVKEAERFVESIDGGDPPAIDDHAATTETLKALSPSLDDVPAPLPDELCNRYNRARRDVSNAKAAMRQVGNEMLAMMGSSRYGVRVSNGRRVAERRQFMRRGYTVEPRQVDALWPVD